MKKKIVWFWLAVGIVVGAVGLGTMNFALSSTNANEFCLSCHMPDAGKEWMESKHYSNSYGVRVGCSDCHMPKELAPGLMRKMRASGEVFAHITGTINTPEKFEARRLKLAETEWARMRANSAQECKNCHFMDTVNNPEKEYLKEMHAGVLEGGQACIECHKGLAHKAPEE
ncbi:MAG: NapC/NirT family cytochrome c [Burkholderiales bacterium]|jgi:cytochrome c-type protein NapC|nr:NapC/NirT family cytochrome c [Burkholderiales bacterium]